MTVYDLLKQLEDEKTKSKALVNMYERNFYDCIRHNDHNSSVFFDNQIRSEEDNIKRLSIAINVIEERVT